LGEQISGFFNSKKGPEFSFHFPTFKGLGFVLYDKNLLRSIWVLLIGCYSWFYFCLINLYVDNWYFKEMCNVIFLHNIDFSVNFAPV
jgi:hypothetical protein